MAKSQTPASAVPVTAVPDGFVKLNTPEGCSGCSFEDTEYSAEDGCVVVPMGAVLSLLAHGFTTKPEAQ